MFQLNQTTCALGNSRKTESGPPLMQGIATQSNIRRNQPYRFGDVTAAQMVPLVIAEFLQKITDQKVDCASDNLEVGRNCLLSISEISTVREASNE